MINITSLRWHYTSLTKPLNKGLETFFRDKFLSWLKTFLHNIAYQWNIRLSSLQWDQNDDNFFMVEWHSIEYWQVWKRKWQISIHVLSLVLFVWLHSSRGWFALNPSLWIKTCHRVLQVVCHGWMHSESLCWSLFQSGCSLSHHAESIWCREGACYRTIIEAGISQNQVAANFV